MPPWLSPPLSQRFREAIAVAAGLPASAARAAVRLSARSSPIAGLGRAAPAPAPSSSPTPSAPVSLASEPPASRAGPRLLATANGAPLEVLGVAVDSTILLPTTADAARAAAGLTPAALPPKLAAAGFPAAEVLAGPVVAGGSVAVWSAAGRGRRGGQAALAVAAAGAAIAAAGGWVAGRHVPAR